MGAGGGGVRGERGLSVEFSRSRHDQVSVERREKRPGDCEAESSVIVEQFCCAVVCESVRRRGGAVDGVINRVESC